MNPKILIVTLLLLAPFSHASENTGLCTYNTYKWNTFEKRAVEFHRVVKPYNQLTEDEVDQSTGCSVCEQDQVTIQLESLPPFKMCARFASRLEIALADLLANGEFIYKVVGYRVGKTRGEIDVSGNRTKFSNHSFGIALDINPHHNGLYGNCLEYGPQCRLIKGGKWLPGQAKGSLTKEGNIVHYLKREGFNWGGEILGKQKDFMHFSPTGY